MNLIGQTLGQYRIIEPIGTGGMATVYKAYQPGLDRYVAIKVLPAQHALTPGFKERFMREAKAVAQLSHPNILPIHDVGLAGDLSYFVMKYVPDRTLARLMGQPMPLPTVSRFIDQVAGALDHAHRRGILHRDVKPANMLLEEEEDWLLLADFGLAKIVEGSIALTDTGAIIGTPAYVSPEQAAGRSVDHRADIYSLGIVLYEMATGRVPYQGETPMGVMFKHVYEPLPLPRSINPDLPEGVERVILKALAKNPADRYERSGELAEALRQAIVTAEMGPGLEEAKQEAGAATLAHGADEEEATWPTPDLEPSPSPSPAPTPPPAAPIATLAPEPPTQPRSPGRRIATGKLALVGSGLLLLVLVVIVGAIVFSAIGGDGNGTTPAASPTGTAAAFVPDDEPTNTPTPTPTNTPQPPTDTSAPTPANTPQPPTSTPTPIPHPQTITAPDGVPMVLVPAGPLEMGSENGDDDEQPVHTVTLDAFYIDQYEVTNARYAVCVGDGACDPPGDTVRYDDPAYADHPVVYVSWYRAQTYCEWREARLPTEAEWEKAARGTDGRIYPWGNNRPSCELAQLNGCSGDTKPVGSFPYGASPYEAYDMAGNVCEWVNDWYDSGYYANSPQENPPGPQNKSSKVLRGGSWSRIQDLVRAASRTYYDPSDRDDDIGFRCVVVGAPG